MNPNPVAQVPTWVNPHNNYNNNNHYDNNNYQAPAQNYQGKIEIEHEFEHESNFEFLAPAQNYQAPAQNYNNGY